MNEQSFASIEQTIYCIVNDYRERIIKKKEAIEYIMDLGFDKKTAIKFLNDSLLLQNYT